ncbi:fibronectin type III domain-containing protein [Ruminiclostridium cellobioparum]|uniref:fibronectin type III domain-containing protein n=1 Tax=Ruminiclostridium cellobioparum TaxID=29355 RepID=UPI00047F33D8|nr:fibronectin type III domain-containing protein [Ruminiclostridium cellobioparum]
MTKLAIRVLTFVLLLGIFISVSFGNMENGHFIEFGQEARAANASCYYDKYTAKKEWYINRQYETAPTEEAILSGSRAIYDNTDSHYYGVSYQLSMNLHLNPNDGTIWGWENKSSYIGPGMEGRYIYYYDWGWSPNDPHNSVPAGDYITRYYVTYCNSTTAYGVFAGTVHSAQRDVSDILIQSNLIATDGTYPDNGKHTDGYWYVKKGSLSINSPAANEELSKMKGCTPSITVSDPDGDTLTCKYYVDSVEKEIKTISNTATVQLVNFSALDISILSDGRHTLKFEVSDGKADPMTMSVDVIVDNSPPVIGTVNITTNDTNINITGSATDTVSDTVSIQYRYAVGSTVSDWSNDASKTINSLTPNTVYYVKYEARDKEGNVSFVERNIRTKAQVPQISFNNNKENSLDLLINDSNPAVTQYQIMAGSRYVNASGILTSSPEWITVPGKKITVTGLTVNTQYNFIVKAKNDEGIETAATQKTGTTLALPPKINIEKKWITYITLKWDAVSGATSYEIEADGKIISTDLETTYTDEGLQPDTSHKYRVRAGNDGGSSEWSPYKEISTLPNPPEIPGNLTGKPAMKNITLTWEVPDRAEGYELEINGRIIQVETNTYIHEGLSTNTSHKYRIRAYNKGGKSQWSEPVTVTTWPDIPSVPKNIMATAEQNSITLTWYSSPYAESYDLQVDEKNTVNTKGMSYTNESLTPGTEHSYKIRAVNISGNGEWSNSIEISTLPQEESSSTTGAAIIANLAAVVTNKTVTIAWQAVEVNAQYDIEVDGAVVNNGKDTIYNHTGLKAETFHTYRVRTKNANGNGQWCAVLALSTLPDLPGAPSNVNVTVTDTQVQLTWTKEEGISYEVEADGESINVGQVSSYTDENLAPGTSHTYRVRGKNITGVTAWSDSITKSTTSPSYELECAKDQEFDFSLLAANVQDFGDITFVVTYNPEELEVMDFCEFTAGKDTVAGTIPGTNIAVTVKDGRIEYKVNESINPGTAWSGEISAIMFRTKTDGKVQVNFNIE